MAQSGSSEGVNQREFLSAVARLRRNCVELGKLDSQIMELLAKRETLKWRNINDQTFIVEQRTRLADEHLSGKALARLGIDGAAAGSTIAAEFAEEIAGLSVVAGAVPELWVAMKAGFNPETLTALKEKILFSQACDGIGVDVISHVLGGRRGAGDVRSMGGVAGQETPSPSADPDLFFTNHAPMSDSWDRAKKLVASLGAEGFPEAGDVFRTEKSPSSDKEMFAMSKLIDRAVNNGTWSDELDSNRFDVLFLHIGSGKAALATLRQAVQMKGMPK